MTEELSRVEQRRKRKRKLFWGRIQAVLIILLVIVLPTVFFGILPWVSGIYDRSHHHTIECEVEKVYWESTSTRSAKGIGASGRQIVFDTKDCRGHILLTEGVYSDNVKELAKSLKPGRYRFTVGDAEWAIAPYYKILKVAPTAQKYKYLG